MFGRKRKKREAIAAALVAHRLAEIETEATALAEKLFALAAGEVEQNSSRFAGAAAGLFDRLVKDHSANLAAAGIDEETLAPLMAMAASHGRAAFEDRWVRLAAALSEGSGARN